MVQMTFPFRHNANSPCRIMSTGMQQNAASLRHSFHIFNQINKIQTTLFIIVIPILPHFETGIGEDRDVIAPRWIGLLFSNKTKTNATSVSIILNFHSQQQPWYTYNINMRVSKSMKYLSKNTQPSSSRQGLNTSDSILF